MSDKDNKKENKEEKKNIVLEVQPVVIKRKIDFSKDKKEESE